MARGVKIFCFMLNLKLLFEVVKVLFLLQISQFIERFRPFESNSVGNIKPLKFHYRKSGRLNLRREIQVSISLKDISNSGLCKWDFGTIEYNTIMKPNRCVASFRNHRRIQCPWTCDPIFMVCFQVKRTGEHVVPFLQANQGDLKLIRDISTRSLFQYHHTQLIGLELLPENLLRNKICLHIFAEPIPRI